MGIFSEIWDRITVSDEERRQHQQDRDKAKEARPRVPKPAGAPVDVEAILERKAAQTGGGGNWRTSIVHLLKLLEIVPVWPRVGELNVHAGDHGSAEQNIALSKAV